MIHEQDALSWWDSLSSDDQKNLIKHYFNEGFVPNAESKVMIYFAVKETDRDYRDRLFEVCDERSSFKQSSHTRFADLKTTLPKITKPLVLSDKLPWSLQFDPSKVGSERKPEDDLPNAEDLLKTFSELHHFFIGGKEIKEHLIACMKLYARRCVEADRARFPDNTDIITP